MDFNFKASDIAKHTGAHILAAAVKRIFPEVKIGIGPVTKTGFYYDFETPRPLTDQDLELIQKNVEQIIQEDLPLSRVIVSKAEGANLLLQMGQIYKSELIQTLPDEHVSFYKLGEEFLDLCRGPHLKSTDQVGIVKVTKVEQTHWNDDETRPVMYRVHGVVFQNIVEFKEYQEQMLTHATRDFFQKATQENLIQKIEDDYSYTTNGSVLIDKIETHILDEFQDSIVKRIEVGVVDNVDKLVTIMDCNFRNKNHSYRKLPITYQSDYYNDYKTDSGSITNKNLLIKFYTNPSNSLIESGDSIEKTIDIFKFFTQDDLNVEIRCSDLENPHVKGISNLLQKKIISHNKILTNEVGHNITIEFKTTDSIGKTWSIGKMMLYANPDNKFYSEQNTIKNTFDYYFVFPITQIFAYLVEERFDSLQFDLKPLQIVCIPKSKDQYEFTNNLNENLNKIGYSSICDTRSRSFKYKIMNAEKRHAGYIFIVGNKEQQNNSVSVRHNNLEVGLVSLDNLVNYISENKN